MKKTILRKKTLEWLWPHKDGMCRGCGRDIRMFNKKEIVASEFHGARLLKTGRWICDRIKS